VTLGRGKRAHEGTHLEQSDQPQNSRTFRKIKSGFRGTCHQDAAIPHRFGNPGPRDYGDHITEGRRRHRSSAQSIYRQSATGQV
jgi:hypothetical protein